MKCFKNPYWIGSLTSSQYSPTSHEVRSYGLVFAKDILSVCLGLYKDTCMPSIRSEWDSFLGFEDFLPTILSQSLDDTSTNMRDLVVSSCLAHRIMKIKISNQSPSDKSHTRLDLATLVAQIYARNDISEKALIKSILEKISFGTYNATVLGLVIACFS
ncbi:hypothetical protein GJ496_009388 [Pomphorhynchus laevis]|nr:hypothetical protein GJ496_009388 [Pomphorhynchus laevis]